MFSELSTVCMCMNVPTAIEIWGCACVWWGCTDWCHSWGENIDLFTGDPSCWAALLKTPFNQRGVGRWRGPPFPTFVRCGSKLTPRADAKWNVTQRFISPKVMWTGVGGVVQVLLAGGVKVNELLLSCSPRTRLRVHQSGRPAANTAVSCWNVSITSAHNLTKREGNWENASIEQEETWGRTKNRKPTIGSVPDSWTSPLKFTEDPNNNFLKLSEVDTRCVSKC